ncbi:hypothetical protein [Stigmatella aurantiaca]|uniref:Endotoxin-binding protein-protease inhibitor n=1 Tax=Stigmatella aurantiaca (strain DW4/3-1) TaxID=378806 RepID=Q08WB5_STIAD|nr:hypothetical protein [Stigmatella aurantiaca]ADO69272.1 Endotoxin-binding protein-protease inhibitor [Stigmatella aurantiaca DW4/3-1]EAU64789.1 endotoxin-binding protein-protease inhibitor, putative [Stigmatella aurantiaca DW4/3-1]
MNLTCVNNLKRWGAFLAQAGLVLVLVVSAAAEAQCFKRSKEQACENWNGNKEFRCASSDKDVPTTQVAVRNRTGRDIRLRYDEWHSICGTPGGKVHSQEFTIPANGSTSFAQLSAGKSSAGPITCREGFIVECKNPDGSGVNCPEALSAQLEYFVGNQQ